MATIHNFEDLEIWQMARAFNAKLIPLLQNLAEAKNFELKNQLDASAGSIMDNIAEGFEREGNREFKQFLSISKGSLGESRSQLYRAFDRGFITQEELAQLQDQCRILAGKISRFMNYLRGTEIKGNKYR